VPAVCGRVASIIIVNSGTVAIPLRRCSKLQTTYTRVSVERPEREQRRS
jgi:hypothetical protein